MAEIHMKVLRRKKGDGSITSLAVAVVPVLTAGGFSVFRGRYESAFLCALACILFLVPRFVKKRLNIYIPPILEITIIFFIFAGLILGEVESFL